MENKIIHIVLLGGGYTSIWAYRSLLKCLAYEIAFGEVQISVVCPEEFHFFHGWTAETLGCIIQDKNRMSPLANIFTRAHLIKAVVEEIDLATSQVYIRMQDGSKESLCYDHLLIGTGSYDSDNIEGIIPHGFQIKSHNAFLRTKEEIQAIVRKAAQDPSVNAAETLSITVAGSGFSGVELVANIAEFVNHLKNKYPSLRNVRPLIRLVNSKNKILNELDPRFGRIRQYAEKTLRYYGVEVINNKKIGKVTPDGAWLDDGHFLQSSMVISAIGQNRMILKGTEGMDRDTLNRVYTNRFMQIPNSPTVWGGGDACAILQCGKERPCPPNALWAIKHGEHAGKNIARAVKRRTLKPFTYKGLGQCASLGIGRGMGEMYGIQFTGWIAWMMRWLFFNYFMPSKKVMFNEIKDWVYFLFAGERKGLIPKKKEISQMVPSELNLSYQVNYRRSAHK